MTDVKRPLKVFLCHAHDDKAQARELYRYLRKRGLQPWLDAEDLLPGQAWQVEIPKALETSDAIIICLSKDSVDKEGYVQKEIKFALDRALEMPEGRIFLIPARLEECDVPRSLSGYHWVDLFDEGGYEKLMKSLKVRAVQLGCVSVKTPAKDKFERGTAKTVMGLIKLEIRLKTDNLEKVLDFLQNRLQKICPAEKKHIVKLDNFPDGIVRTITHTYSLSMPYRGKNTLLMQCTPSMTTFPGEFDVNAGETQEFHTYDAIKFMGWETQKVFLELEYDKTWQDEVDLLVTKLYDLFGKYNGDEEPVVADPPSKPESPQNISIHVNGNLQGNLIVGNENAVQSQVIQSTPEKPVKTKPPVDIEKKETEKPVLLPPGVNKEPEKPPRKLKPGYIVAIISAAVTILAALIGILPQIINPVPLPTTTITAKMSITQAPIALFTVISPSETTEPSKTLEPSHTLTTTYTSTVTPTAKLKAYDPHPVADDYHDSFGIPMRLVPAGAFLMGSDSEKPVHIGFLNSFDSDNEKPAHTVYLASFYIDKYEVTNLLYKACVEAGSCINSYWQSFNYGNYGGPQFGNYPVFYVDWVMAKKYCEWRGARLPTEAEWEKSARGAFSRKYPWGNFINCDMANYGQCIRGLTEVGKYVKGISPYEIYDMAGNVLEWVSSKYKPYPYDPNDGRENSQGVERVLRGGSWAVNDVRTTLRLHEEPDNWSNDDVYKFAGIRCARDVNP